MLSMVAHAYDPKSRRLRQEEIESEACLGYIAISRPAGRHSETLSYMNKNHPSPPRIHKQETSLLLIPYPLNVFAAHTFLGL